MQHRTVQDVMTRDVVTARREASVKEVAELLDRHGVTALPIVDDSGRPIGLVSEGDLVRKEAGQPEGRYRPPRMGLGDRLRADAETAEGMMSSPVVTAHPDWSIVRAARVMDARKVKRLPVVDGTGRLVGIVSRRDLLRLFLRPDQDIEREITGDVLGEMLWLTHDAVRVSVDDGVVTLTGKVGQKSLLPIVERLCASVDGVVAVHQRLEYAVDDTQGTDPPAGEPA
ncbi:CBS domain-containing protein [Kitasatospora sp. NPDC127111]|uniref:CBS domain-containing protein n=1 Tax=Kitasatospora sp. NPDC127111 TaxID=3345363 RepID=UPI003624CE06